MRGPFARKLITRALRWEWGRTVLAILSVALGVAVFLAVRLANRAAVASFEAYAQGAGRGATWSLHMETGAIPETQLATLEPLRHLATFQPLVEGAFTDKDQEPYQLLGLDLVDLGPAYLGQRSPAKDEEAFERALEAFLAPLQRPDVVLITERMAREGGLKVGSSLEGSVDDRLVRLHVGGIIPERPDVPQPPRNVLIMDLPALQTLLRRPGQVDRVELSARPGVSPADLADATRALLPPGLLLEPPEQRAATGSGLSEAYRFNLLLMSVVSLAVGAFLLFQAFDAAVYRRRETWATLRALGASAGLVQRVVIKEALVVGSLGSLVGVGLGWGMAQLAVRFVSQTLRLHYGLSQATSAELLPEEALVAFASGLIACLVAAWVPARRASRTPPIPLLKRGGEAQPIPWRPLAFLGIGLLLLGFLLPSVLRLPPGVAWHAYLGSGLVLLGGSLATTALLPLLGLPGRHARSWIWRLRLRPLQRPTGRHAFSAAALSVAVGMAVGVGIMVRSFEHTLDTWIRASQRADLYVTPLGAAGASTHRLSKEAQEALAQDAAVNAADPFEQVSLMLGGRPTFLGSHDFEVLAPRGAFLMSRGGEPQEVLNAIHTAGLAAPGAIVSESFAQRFQIDIGGHLEVPTPQGPRSLRIHGIFQDYGNEHGAVLIDRPVFQAWFHEDRATALALFLKAGESRALTAKRLSRAYPGLKIQTQAENRERAHTLFQQTFGITYALELIALTVALVGLVQAVLSLALARRSELWTLRALGAREQEITRILMGEGLGMAVAGLVGGVVLGGVMARILVHELQPQKFGWSLSFTVPWGALAGLAVLSLLAAGLSILPATRWGARLRVDREAEEGA